MTRRKRKPINETLREYRELREMQQVDAASRLGVTPEHLCRIELGTASASLPLLRRARELYEIDELILD